MKHLLLRCGIAHLLIGTSVALASQADPKTADTTKPEAPQPAESSMAEPSPEQVAEDARLREKIDARVEAIREMSEARRTEALESAARATDEIDRRLHALEQTIDESWDRTATVTNARSQAALAELRRRRTALAEWYGGMRYSSVAAWSDVKVGFVLSYHELAIALRKAASEFRQPPLAEPAAEASPGESATDAGTDKRGEP